MSGNFAVYLIGYIVAIIGVAFGMSAAGLAQQWIIAVVLIMVGLGIVYALSRAQGDQERREATKSGTASQTGSSTASPSSSSPQSERSY